MNFLRAIVKILHLKLYAQHLSFCMIACILVASNRLYAKDLSDNLYTATVSASGARFYFHLPQRSEWSWNQPATRDNREEYRWTVEIASKEHGDIYDFGFFLFKRPGNIPARGDINALLQAGQVNVWVKSSNGRGSVLPDARVKVTAFENKLMVKVDDPDLLRRIFSKRPQWAIFHVWAPNENPMNYSATITYL